MTRLARRVRRLEAARGACPTCRGVAGLVVVLDDEPAPERACRRFRRPPLVMRIVETTKEEHDAGQSARQAHHAA